MSGGPQGVASFEPIVQLALECARNAELRACFGTEAACVAWLRERRWPDGLP